jgi:hypothetical protein
MKKSAELDQINQRLREHVGDSYEMDTKLFEIGVELGRYLQKTNVTSYTTPVIAETAAREKHKKAAWKKLDQIIKILRQFVEAAAQLTLQEQQGPIRYSADIFDRQGQDFPQSISDKCYVQHQTTIASDFQIEVRYTFYGQVLEVFKKYQIFLNISLYFYDTDGQDALEINEVEEFKRAKAHMHNGYHNYEKVPLKTLDQLRDEIDQLRTLMLLSL